MSTTGRLIPDNSFTLPDEYFEERLSRSAGEISAIQDEALPKAFAYAFEHSSFYHAKFTEAGLGPGSIRGLQDLSRLPFTVTEEIRPDPGQGRTIGQIMAVDPFRVSVVHRSSGTTGAPKIFPYTGRDAARWGANVATVNWLTGVRKSDVLVSAGLSREFTGSGGLYLGALTLGVTYIPITIGPGVSETIVAHLTGRMKINGKVVELDPLLRANLIHCMGSFLPRLVELLDEFNVQPQDLLLTKIVHGAEPSPDEVRRRVAARLGIRPREDYGLGEFYGPGVAGECDAGDCLHVLSDTFIAEVIDPDTGEPTLPGQAGELVLTSLHKDALPLFRYRTGDLTTALSQDCPCGLGHTRVGRITGRVHADDIILPGGVVINRAYLEEVLLPVDGMGCEYAVTLAEHARRKGSQRFCIAIEAEGGANLAHVIAHRFQVEYKYKPVIHILPIGAVPRSWGKAKRIYTQEEYQALVAPFVEGDLF